jgi:probable rRNA maturation factor
VSNSLTLRNHTGTQPLDLVFLRRIVRFLLRDLLCANGYELGIYILDGEGMIRLNETFLRHRGVTDVITFNYVESPKGAPLKGEIFVCSDEAFIQAKRFGVSWPEELVRYMVHGILHLLGYDDRRKTDRLKMKRRENQLVSQLAQTFRLETLGRSQVAEKPRSRRGA